MPHDPDRLAHLVRLQLKIGGIDLAKHIKEIKVRAHVVLKLGCCLIEAGHAAYVSLRVSLRINLCCCRIGC